MNAGTIVAEARFGYAGGVRQVASHAYDMLDVRGVALDPARAPEFLAKLCDLVDEFNVKGSDA